MTFTTHTFPNDPYTYITPTWREMQELTFQVAQRALASGRTFDRIVTLAKGGWPMTRCLVDFLEVTEVASIGVKFYSGIHERYDRPQIYQDLPVAVGGERILLFDDVADTGQSLKFTYDYLLGYRGVKELSTASLFTKPHSILAPDFSGAETDAWIIFPYDAVEMVVTLGAKWQEGGVAAEEVMARFDQLGFQADWVRAYLKNKPAT